MRLTLPLIALLLACQNPAPAPPTPRAEPAEMDPGPQPQPEPESPEQAAPEGLTGVLDVVVLTSSTCVLTEDRAVYCWGEGSQGMLGQGSWDDSDVPVRVAGLDDAIQLSGGNSHLCALRATGQVVCWGSNHQGLLGDGTEESRKVPTPVLDLDEVVEVSAGDQSTCARRASGEVLCWGRDLTRSMVAPGGPREHFLAQPIEGLSDVRKIASGSTHTCVLQGDAGQLSCWGLAHGITSPDPKQMDTLEDTGLTGVEDVVAGSGVTCFQKDSAWRCWGQTYAGQLGFEQRDTLHPAEAVAIPELEEATHVALSDKGGCAVDPVGDVYCWGDKRTAQKLKGLEEPTARIWLSGGHWEHLGCALSRTGALRCWGKEVPPYRVPAPQSTEPWSLEKNRQETGAPFVADEIAAGYDETCARKGGEVWCWGERHNRTFADPDRHRPRPEQVKGIDDAVQLAAGFGFMCARRAIGAVTCWGENTNAQLGDGTRDKHLNPVAVLDLDDTIALSAGSSSACVIRESGSVWCWGSGKAPYESTLEASWTRKKRIRQLALGAGHRCVLLDAGEVWCRGSNNAGQLGNGEGGCKPDPDDFPCPKRSRCKQREICARSDDYVQVQGLDDAVSVAAGGSFTCALREGGKVSCWGESWKGQLGLGPEKQGDIWTPEELTALEDVVELVADNSKACARVKEGRVFCWGQNVFGDLGDRTTQNRFSPSEVYGIDDAIEVRAGMSHACLRREDGAVWCWGDNGDDALGVGHNDERHVTAPLPVLAP